MAECPKCRSEIGAATFCGCGWKKYAKPGLNAPIETTVKCCHDDCLISARVKVQTAYGWANFCVRHYEDYHLAQARKTCEAMGLDTMEKQRAWCLKKLPHITRQREPGDDDEPVTQGLEETPA